MMATSTAAQTAAVTAAQLREIAERFELRRREEVEAYLTEHPYLVPLLLEAREVIPRYFGDAPVDLEVVTFFDAEDDEDGDDRQLYAHIHTRLRPPESADQLHRFDRDWWLDALDPAHGQLTITVRHV